MFLTALCQRGAEMQNTTRATSYASLARLVTYLDSPSNMHVEEESGGSSTKDTVTVSDCLSYVDCFLYLKIS